MTARHLVACPTCARHVRVSEASCPFCATALGESQRDLRAPRAPAQRLGRAALYALGVGLAAAACSGSANSVIGDDAGGTDDGQLGRDGSGTLKGGIDCVNGPDYTGCPCDGTATRVCYTGAPATLGVAPCAPGVQRCLATQEAQYAYGPCEGETLPTATATCASSPGQDAGRSSPAEDAGVRLDATLEDSMSHAAYGAFPIDASFAPEDSATPDAEFPDDAEELDATEDVAFGAAYGAPGV
jgi:hypothetical protein